MIQFVEKTRFFFLEKIKETAKKRSLLKLEKLRNTDYLKLETF